MDKVQQIPLRVAALPFCFCFSDSVSFEGELTGVVVLLGNRKCLWMAFRFGGCQWTNVTSNLQKLQSSVLNCWSSESRRIHLSSYLSMKDVDDAENINEASDLKLPDEPTNCCMSGCANCVWIKYAEELVKNFDGGSDLARKIILDKVEDPNMRAFLDMELRTLNSQ